MSKVCKCGKPLVRKFKHRLKCGDSTDAAAVKELMGGEQASMVFTDPPYGVAYEQGKFTGKKVKNKFKNQGRDS